VLQDRGRFTTRPDRFLNGAGSRFGISDIKACAQRGTSSLLVNNISLLSVHVSFFLDCKIFLILVRYYPQFYRKTTWCRVLPSDRGLRAKQGRQGTVLLNFP
jgi:hypothetical protein